MKELSNYINEKLDINRVNLNDKFPINKDNNVIVEFLINHNFKEILYDEEDGWRNIHQKFAKNKGKKVFHWSGEVLRFANTTKDINEKNPIFCINDNRHIWLELLADVTDINVNQKEFLELLNEVFGWQ